MTVMCENLAALCGQAGDVLEVQLSIVGSDDAFTSAGTVIGWGTVHTTAEGEWCCDLPSNEDPTFLPVGAVWQRDVYSYAYGRGRGNKLASQTFSVPVSGGPLQVRDHLVDPPGTLETPAVSALAVRVTALEAEDVVLDGRLDVLELRSSTNSSNVIRPPDHSLVAWNYDPVMASAGEVATNGRLTLFRIQIRETVTVSNIWFWVTTVAVTPTAGQNWCGIYDSTRTKLVEASADGTVITTQGVRTVAVTPTQLAAGFYFVALLFNASTAPTMARTNALGGSGSALNAGLTVNTGRTVTAATGATTLPSSIPSPSGLGGSVFWVAVS